jgi:hypothetical protein
MPYPPKWEQQEREREREILYNSVESKFGFVRKLTAEPVSTIKMKH